MGERQALAYDQPVHAALSRRAYRGPDTLSTKSSNETLSALRELVWRSGDGAHDESLRNRFLSRYPDLAKFDTWELKRFLGLNPDKAIHGIDDLPEVDGEPADLYAQASRWPDDDERNQARFAHDAARKVRMDSFGRPLPDDPATLEMGSLTGLSSQAHAHYGLPHLQFSDDPQVLKSDPRRFAVPPTVHTFGAEFADVYTDLALLAARLPDGEPLSVVFAGAAAHHIEDVANQIHTVQVGDYDFFVDAKIESIKLDLLSVGGLLHSRPDFITIGIGIIENHHTLAEALYAKHLLTAGDPVAKQTESARVDETFASQLSAIGSGTSCPVGFGRALTENLIERSSFEGPQVYDEIRKVALRKWSRAGEHFSGDPDVAIRPGAKLDAFFALEVAGAARATQTLRHWWRHFDLCKAGSPAMQAQIAEALIRIRLDALDAQDDRARKYVSTLPAAERVNPWIPAGYLLFFTIFILAGRAWRRRASQKARS